jgi:hypothetical protein
VTGEPVFLTGGVATTEYPNILTVRRAGLAVPFALSVTTPAGRRDFLTGVFSWASVNLDKPGARRDRTWFDLGMSREQASTALEGRVYEVGREQ